VRLFARAGPGEPLHESQADSGGFEDDIPADRGDGSVFAVLDNSTDVVGAWVNHFKDDDNAETRYAPPSTLEHVTRASG
jgi:hypothetical protein